MEEGKIFKEACLKRAKLEFDALDDKSYRIAEFSNDEMDRMTIDKKLTAVLKNFSE